MTGCFQYWILVQIHVMEAVDTGVAVISKLYWNSVTCVYIGGV